MTQTYRKWEAYSGPAVLHAVLNNGATQHFQKLAHHGMELLARAEKGRGRAQQAANALTFLRIILKHLTENLNATQLVAFVNEPLQSSGVANGSAGAAANDLIWPCSERSHACTPAYGPCLNAIILAACAEAGSAAQAATSLFWCAWCAR